MQVVDPAFICGRAFVHGSDLGPLVSSLPGMRQPDGQLAIRSNGLITESVGKHDTNISKRLTGPNRLLWLPLRVRLAASQRLAGGVCARSSLGKPEPFANGYGALESSTGRLCARQRLGQWLGTKAEAWPAGHSGTSCGPAAWGPPSIALPGGGAWVRRNKLESTRCLDAFPLGGECR